MLDTTPDDTDGVIPEDDGLVLRCPHSRRIFGVVPRGASTGRLRVRCKDRNCPESQMAKRTNRKAFHVFDVSTGKQWTVFEEKRK